MHAWLVASFSLFELVHRNWALTGILATLAVLVLVPWFVIRKYVRIISNLFRDAPVPMSMEARDYDPLPGETVEFRSFDGQRLAGVLFSANPNVAFRGTLIFAHELDSTKSSAARYCRGLIDAGYEVFAFDFRGQGESPCEPGYSPLLWPSDREQSDLLGAIAYVEDYLDRHGRPKRLGLIGVSRGAGSIILGAVGVASVKAIMVDGAFSTDAYLEYLMRRWVSIFAKVRLVYENHHPLFWRFLRWLTMRRVSRHLGCRYPSVRKAIDRLGRTPIFIIHGERDGHIPVAQARMLYDIAHGPKYVWICPGAKHNQSVAVQPEQYESYSVRFFDCYLAQRRPSDEIDQTGLLSDLTQPIVDPVRISHREYAKYTVPERSRRKAKSKRKRTF